jgi:hypothetical protein
MLVNTFENLVAAKPDLTLPTMADLAPYLSLSLNFEVGLEYFNLIKLSFATWRSDTRVELWKTTEQ